MTDDLINTITALIPDGKGCIDWNALELTSLSSLFEKMKNTPQNPQWHGEGNVFTHTKAVCDKLVGLPEYALLCDEERTILFLAALLHDIGKTVTTVTDENGRIISPHHSSKGSVMARFLLWTELNLSGSTQKQLLRETVCNLIRYHSLPPRGDFAANDELKYLKAASNGQLTDKFTFRLLCLLSKADVLGRIASDTEEQLEKIEYCKIAAQEYGCFDGAYHFSSDCSQRAYFKGKTSWKEHNMYDDTWGEVILICGLPGTGKDTWIQNNIPELPMVSLDVWRIRLGISPTDEQGMVIASARDEAKEYLRKKQSFVWNATNITPTIREKQITLFEGYGASVRIYFLETGWDEQFRRNKERKNEVPQSVIEKLVSKTVLPERFESRLVEWKCI